jgi:uncharacterized protein (DUF1697 family)
MTTQIALLRAINVAGRAKVGMADLRQVFAALGLADVRTVLQTGNVIFESKGRSGRKLESDLESALAETLSLQTDVLIRSAREWDAIIAANPFPGEAASDPGHLVLMPLKDEPGQDALEELRAVIKGRERVGMAGPQLYITYPDGIGRSKLTNALIEKKLGTRGTGRNWNTALKIAETMRTRDR